MQQILNLASQLRARPAGWSAHYPKLDAAEKSWLDLAQQTKEAEKNDPDDDWPEIIADRFANWFNQWLSERYPAIRHDFTDAEQQEWYKTLLSALRAASRQQRRTA